MKTFFTQFFTWWNGQTLGTRFFTWRSGERVGEDEFGNVYYRTRGGRLDPALGFERRWVVYNGDTDASRIPPGWYGWMHRQSDTPPTASSYVAKPWEKAHLPNLTGTTGAYRPKGSTLSRGERPSATGDYKAWTPGG
jgi:NADH:ubiquinone oxidoreductase subunit